MLDSFISILVSGGITIAAVVSACKWIIKQILEGSIKVHNEKVIKDFENILEKQNKILDINLNYHGHILQNQYDEEYKNYLEIWKKLQEYIKATLKLRDLSTAPALNYEKQKERNDKNNEEWEKCKCEYEELVAGKAPFYQKRHYEKFLNLNSACSKLHAYYEGKKYNVQINENKVQEYIKDILELQNELMDDLRDYIQSLKIINELK